MADIKPFLTPIGLIADLLGAILLAIPLFTSKKRAIELGVGRWASDNDEENLKLPEVQDRLRSSRFAVSGAVLLALGFLLQLLDSWP